SPLYAQTVEPLKRRATEALVGVLRDEGVEAAEEGDSRTANQRLEYIRQLEAESSEEAIA
ncbi:MAG: hypothetical protein GWN71_33805, partial [Gammaproteobacteria bacterium]|nr:hypothetical protein [Gemmatimonadota bacterium]NIU78355.1 hypothetical protein [Gammaproteobacteria bacterium]